VITVLERAIDTSGHLDKLDTPHDRLDQRDQLVQRVALVRRARRGPARRSRMVIGGLGLTLVLVFAARVLLGDYTITVPDFFRILWGADIPGASYILTESKLPRALLGVLVGVAFGIAGAIFQTTLRNPLASPDIIGVSVGASAAAVFAIVTLDRAGPWVSAAAVAGAVTVSVVVRLVAGTVGGFRLVLVGIAMAAALQSVIQYLFTRADMYDAQLALRWLTGSVNRADWPTLQLLAGILLVLLPVLAWLARSLRVTELGEDTAAGLGVRPHRADALLLLAVLLTAVAVAAAGPIAFVSFLAGPIARALNSGRTSLVGAGLAGALIVVGADYVADYLLADTNFPVGVVTGAFGAPFLLWLLARGRTGRRAA
jgi:iron complex transport system permease protein